MMKRKSFEDEIAEIATEKDALIKIFRELWDIRKANESMARTLESENV